MNTARCRNVASLLLLAGLTAAGTSRAAGDPPSPPASSDARTAGIAFGYTLGERMRDDMPGLDIEGLVEGLRAAYRNDGNAPMSETERRAVVTAFQARRMEQKLAEQEALATANRVASETFLAENGKRPAVVTTASGLQYEILAKGNGPAPGSQDNVLVRYHGTLLDGTVVDSTRWRDDEPTDVPLRNTVPGWQEGVSLMNKGAKYRFYIPPALAYGDLRYPKVVGPNAVLVFEIELITFTPTDTPAY